MALELEVHELNVENFRTNMLCRNAADGSRVLIENQLEWTDHNQLVQILAYAAGLDIHTVIWIAKAFTEELRHALDRLNETSNEKAQYFGIEVKVWQIENSTPAPQFEIVSKPKDWRRPIIRDTQRAASKETSETELQLKRFWTEWHDYMIQIGKPLKRPQSGKWSLINFDTEHSGDEFYIDAYLIKEKKEIGIRLCIERQSEMKYFYPLKKQRKEIEREFAEPLTWHESLEYEGSRIFLRKTDIDLTDETDWPNQHEWLASKLELFDKVFRPRLKALTRKGGV